MMMLEFLILEENLQRLVYVRMYRTYVRSVQYLQYYVYICYQKSFVSLTTKIKTFNHRGSQSSLASVISSLRK